MSWSLDRWIWQLEAPLFIGMPPSGALNRCRLYVPARAIWGSMTAELAQREAGGFPDYPGVGQQLRTDARLTYLYPAEQTPQGWRAWLPLYADSAGLVWHPEHSEASVVSDRGMRRRLLGARPGTAIEHETDTAAEATLRETECVETRWRNQQGMPGSAVGMAGYVLVREGTDLAERVGSIGSLFVGGDTRYGLGRLRRVERRKGAEIFGHPVDLGRATPLVTACRVLAHARAGNDGGIAMAGDLEALTGWDARKSGAIEKLADALWRPGSRVIAGSRPWTIDPDGLWSAASTVGDVHPDGEVRP